MRPTVPAAAAMRCVLRRASRCCRVCQAHPTVAANVLALQLEKILEPPAEDAGRLVLAHYDPITVHKDLDSVPLLQTTNSAQLYGQNDPPQLVQLSHDSGSLHLRYLLPRATCVLGSGARPLTGVYILFQAARLSFGLCVLQQSPALLAHALALQ